MSKLRLPAIVKPNYEGSSKGITQDSIAETSRDLRRKVQDALMHYPEGILVEEFIAGKDVTVPFLAAIENDYGGVLSPSEYVVEGRSMHGRPYSIYDYELKNTYDEDVSILAPASASSSSLGEMRRSAHDAFHLVACQDLGRVDFRLTWDGVPYLLEINPLPSLERGAAIYAAAEVEGLSLDGVIASIILSACERR
jgi:D-alanine-D-alanine ligase